MLDDRPVYIILPGPSVEKIKPYLTRLEKIPHVKATVNRFNILEKRLAVKFGVVYVSSILRFDELEVRLVKFMKRKGTKLITNSNCFYKFMFSFKDFRNGKEYFVSDLGYEPGTWHNSLTNLILAMAWMGFQRFFLFGCDGYADSSENVYFSQKDIKPEDENFGNRVISINRDTRVMNDQFWKLFTKYRMWHTPTVMNVSPDSKVECFQKLTHEEACHILDV